MNKIKFIKLVKKFFIEEEHSLGEKYIIDNKILKPKKNCVTIDFIDKKQNISVRVEAPLNAKKEIYIPLIQIYVSWEVRDDLPDEEMIKETNLANDMTRDYFHSLMHFFLINRNE